MPRTNFRLELHFFIADQKWRKAQLARSKNRRQDTKEQILITALRLFAQNGYEAVSTSMIAGELGMTKGALYKHYKNKQGIFDSIMARMVGTSQEQPEEQGIPKDAYEDAPAAYQGVSLEED